MANRFLVSAEEGIAEPAWMGRAEEFLALAMKSLGFDGEELSVLFCGDEFMRALNAQYRGVDSATDVLSFEDGSEFEEDGVRWRAMGDIAVSVETLESNSAKFGVPQDEELKRLLVHGILHLNGMDHGEEHLEPGGRPACEMLRLQESVLQSLGDFIIIEGSRP